MDDEEILTHAFTLELENGVRVGVNLITTNAIYETRCSPPRKIRIRNEIRTCGGQTVVPDRDDPYRATVLTDLGNVAGRIVDRGVSLSDTGILRPVNSET